MPYNPNDSKPDTLNRDSVDALGMGRTLLYLDDASNNQLRALTPSDLTGSSATLSGTTAQRQAIPLASLAQKTQWNETDGKRRTVWFTPGDTTWRTSDGADPDAPDTGSY